MRLPPIRIRTRLGKGALAALYGEQEPFCYTSSGTRAEPLTTVSVFEATPQETVAHWHYVAFGLRDRFGLELTFRLARREGAVPDWPVTLLQRFARHVVESGVPFEGHHVEIAQRLAERDSLGQTIEIATAFEHRSRARM